MIWPIESPWWELLLLVHASVTWFLAGLIWFVQIVHYPMLVDRADARFVATQQNHQRRTGYVVAAPMALELVTAILLLLLHPANAESVTPASLAGSISTAVVGLVLVLANVLMTAVLFVPLHHRLTRGYDPQVARRLVRWNWVRTATWSSRAALVASWWGMR